MFATVLLAGFSLYAQDDSTWDDTPYTEEELPEPTSVPTDEPAKRTVPDSKPVSPKTYSAEDRATRYYTYAGGTISSGFNSVSYTGWSGERHTTIEESGFYAQPSLCLIIIAPPLMGQLNTGFAFNFNDSELTSIHHLKADARIKYMYSKNLPITLTGGAGFYTELPPATKTYDGGGVLLALGFLYPLSSEWSLLLDFDLGYGYFGKGTEGRKLTYGITFGAVIKAGNL